MLLNKGKNDVIRSLSRASVEIGIRFILLPISWMLYRKTDFSFVEGGGWYKKKPRLHCLCPRLLTGKQIPYLVYYQAQTKSGRTPF